VIATEESDIDAYCVARLTTDEFATALRQRVPRLARQSETADEPLIISTSRREGDLPKNDPLIGASQRRWSATGSCAGRPTSVTKLILLL